MAWIFLSVTAAFGQALAWALKKKSLQNSNLNNTLGAVAYLAAGAILSAIWFFVGFESVLISQKFIVALLVVVLLNVLATCCAFRALDYAGISQLMPFIAVTALLIIPLEYISLGTLPNLQQIYGITLVVLGVLFFSGARLPRGASLSATLLFGVTLTCYAITSTGMAVMLAESNDPFFSAAIMHLGIGICFLPLMFRYKETATLKNLATNGKILPVIGVMVLVGVIAALLENGPIFLALESASAAEVFSLKRLMPLFALLFGIYWFKEKVKKRHIVGTVFMILGAMTIIWFQG